MKRFLAAAAIAPLCFAAMEARAQTTISDARTAPVQTSTTGDLTIAAGGSITVTNDAAVTVNTPATVTNSGTIDIKDATNPATGILVTAPSGAIVSGGVVNVTDTETLKDNDGDGDLDGPFVTSTVPKFGIRVTNPFTGSISQPGGQILIRGNNSAAISIDQGMTGDLTTRGASVLVGANSSGVRVSGPFTGNIDIGGSVSAQGQNSEGVSILGPVSGRMIVQGTVVGTGFRYATRSLPFDLSKLDADDLLLGGPGVRINSSIAGGLLVNAVTANTDVLDSDNNPTTPDIADPHPDEDGDGIPDSLETDGSITSYGTAPGLLIAGPGAITLGNVGTGVSAYGLSIKGSVVGNGLFDGFDATAVQLGGGGGSVNTSGGVRVGGLVFSNAVLANARGLVLGSGASAPALVVDGQIQAATTSNGVLAPTAVAVQIDAGGSLTSLTNNGTVAANIVGVTGTATAIQDNAGALSQITNTGAIRGSLNQANATDVLVGRGIAMDLRANTGGVSVTQTHSAAEAITPGITGDILFGSGNASLSVLEGAVTGDVAFGSGVNSLTINGTKTTTDTVANTTTTVVNGSVTGKLTNAGALSVAVLSGSLTNTNTGSVNLTSLNVGSAGTLGFTLNPAGTAGATGTQYVVSGPAAFANGSKIDLQFGSKLTNTQTFTLVQSSGLTNGGLSADLLGATPFVYTTALGVTANALNVTIGRRTTEQLGLAGGRAAAYDPIFAAFDADAGVSRALLSKTDQAGFSQFYNQLLPDYSGGAFHSLATASRAVMRAQADEPAGMQTNERRSWLQEVGFTTSNQGNGSEISYDTAGFGLAGGMEDPLRRGGVRGMSIAFVSSDIDDAGRQGFSKLTASALLGSLYWRNQFSERLLLNASVTGGYTWFDSDRHVIDEDSTGARILQRQAGGKWNGALGAARLAASYDIPLGRIYIRPDASLDYVYLYEGGYSEHGGGVSVDLAVNHRTSYEAAAEAGVTVGATFGRAFRWTPEVRVAYRTNLAEGISETTARFLAGGNPFLLRALGVDQNRFVVRAAIRGGSRYANVALEATGDLGDVYSAYEGRLVVRFIF